MDGPPPADVPQGQPPARRGARTGRGRLRWPRWLAWAALIAAPLGAIAIMCLASGSSLQALDAWSTTWNDEQSYYWSVQQMLLFDGPTGAATYDEELARYVSYGAYMPATYVPYVLGALVLGVGTADAGHNWVYVTNIALTVLACAAIVVLARPGTRASALLAVFFLFQFIIARYAASGMVEASFVLFAALFAGCALWLVASGGAQGAHGAGRHARNAPPGQIGVVLVFVLMIAAVAFWGAMRPYLLVFILTPCVLLAVGRFGLSRVARVLLFALAVAAAVASVAAYLHFSRYYSPPYFGAESMANSMGSMLQQAAAGFLPTQVEAVAYAGKSLLELRWAGVILFTFALLWVLLLVLAVRFARRGRKVECALLVSLLLAGFALYEANILLYTVKQAHRMFIAADVLYVVVATVLMCPGARHVAGGAPNLGGASPSASAATGDSARMHAAGLSAPVPVLPRAAVAVQAVLALACVAALAAHPGNFALPQAVGADEAAAEAAYQDELAALMPQGEDLWDNTVAHPVESGDMRLYFYLPAYTALSCCQDSYLRDGISQGTLKSKYLCLPEASGLNDLASRNCTQIWQGSGHVLYLVR